MGPSANTETRPLALSHVLAKQVERNSSHLLYDPQAYGSLVKDTRGDGASVTGDEAPHPCFHTAPPTPQSNPWAGKVRGTPETKGRVQVQRQRQCGDMDPQHTGQGPPPLAQKIPDTAPNGTHSLPELGSA
jgi:hypothetical protein